MNLWLWISRLIMRDYLSERFHHADLDGLFTFEALHCSRT